jgi:multidrug efflux pump subunit AcrA (membrane-fusion protein)
VKVAEERRQRRRRWIALVAPVLLLGAWWLVEAVTDDEIAEWVEVRRDDLLLDVEVTGTLRAVDSSVVGTPQLLHYWNYKISHMAPEGEEIAAGTPVLAFDTTELEQRLLRQQAEADEAAKQIDKTAKNLTMQRRQDELSLSEAEAKRRRALLIVERPGELSSTQELAQARLDLELAQKELAYFGERLEASRRSAEATLAALTAQRQRAEREVEEIQQAIQLMTRPAPRDGTVIYLTDWRDEKKKVGDACWRGEMVIELPDLSRMKADGSVDEEDAGKVREEQPVTLRLDAHPDLRYTGRVASIWSTVRSKSWRSPLKVVRLEIELDETDRRRMRPGMRFRGEIETERLADLLLVPIEAVFPTADGPVVYRRTLLGFDAVPVELGRRNERYVEVLSGLRDGDDVSTIHPG